MPPRNNAEDKMSIAFVVQPVNNANLEDRRSSLPHPASTPNERARSIAASPTTPITESPLGQMSSASSSSGLPPTPLDLPRITATSSSTSSVPTPATQPEMVTESSSNPIPSSPVAKTRGSRPIYSEEQKFFIMCARILRDQSWPEIEDEFARIFRQRSKDGLTSIYYRLRKDWGLRDVLKNDPTTYSEDRRAVDERAMNFSRDFLQSIGYLE